MSNETVSWALRLKDEFSASFGKFKQEASSAEGSVNILRKSIGLLTGAFGVYAGIEFFKSSLEAAKESKMAVAQLNASLESTKHAAGISREELDKWGSALSAASTYGKTMVTTMQSVLLTFPSIKGDVFNEASLAIANMSQKLGQDLTQTSIQVGKALQDPIHGITALHRVGVNFSEAQKVVIKTLVNTGQTAKAQQLILKELALEFGGSAKAALDADPILKITKAFGGLKKEVGLYLEEGLVILIPYMIELIKWFKEAFHWIEENKGVVKTLGVAVATYVALSTTWAAIEKIKVWWLGLSKAAVIANMIATDGLVGAQIALNVAMEANPIGAIIVAVTALAAGIYGLIQHYKTLKEEYAEQVNKKVAHAIEVERLELLLLIDQYKKLHHVKQEIAEQAVVSFKKNDLAKQIADFREQITALEAGPASFMANGQRQFSVEHIKTLREQIAIATGQMGALSDKGFLKGKPGKEGAPGADITAASVKETKNTVINISINKQIESLTFHTTTAGEAASKIQELVEKALATAINDAQLLVQ